MAGLRAVHLLFGLIVFWTYLLLILPASTSSLDNSSQAPTQVQIEAAHQEPLPAKEDLKNCLKFQINNSCGECLNDAPFEFSDNQDPNADVVEAHIRSSSALVEQFLTEVDHSSDDLKLFKVISQWKDLAGDSTANVDTPDIRHATAKALVAKHVRLHRIDPRFLSTDVASSGLVTTEQLMEAYKEQALAAQRLHNADFSENTSWVFWKSSRSNQLSQMAGGWKTDTLEETHPMVLGTVHRWTIKIGTFKNVVLGIAKNQDTLNLNTPLGEYLGERESNGWGYQYNGSTYHNGVVLKFLNRPPMYSEGSQVTLELNLVPDGEKSGTLSASVDGGDFFLLFDGLLDDLDEDGFVPAASLDSKTTIRLTSIEML